MKVRLSWRAGGAETSLVALAERLSTGLGRPVKATFGRIYLTFKDETAQEAKQFLDLATQTMKDYPDIEIEIRRKAIFDPEEIETYLLVQFGLPAGEKLADKGAMAPQRECSTCHKIHSSQPIVDKIILRKKLPATTAATLGKYTLVNHEVWNALKPLIQGEVDLMPVSGTEEYVVFQPKADLGLLAGDIVYADPCPDCGAVRIKQNGNIMPTFSKKKAQEASILKSEQLFSSLLFAKQPVTAVFKKFVANLRPWPCRLV